MTVAFLNWSIFEWPGVDLEEIDIPLRSFTGGALPSATDVAEMVDEFRRNSEELGKNVDADLRNRLDGELQYFDVDPQDIGSYLQAPSLAGDGCGTHFIIKPSSELLPAIGATAEGKGTAGREGGQETPPAGHPIGSTTSALAGWNGVRDKQDGHVELRRTVWSNIEVVRWS